MKCNSFSNCVKTFAGLLILTLGYMSIAKGQWVLSDEHINYTRSVDKPFPNIAFRNTGLDTLTISASDPFFDDFSNNDGKPDTLWWFTPESFSDVPELTYHKAIDPPSYGTVTFDGIATTGAPYSPNGLVSGVADRLFSHCIDLSGYQPGDQLVLSFSLQAQGRGDRPEATDEFEVFFRSNNPAPDDYIQVLDVRGGAGTSFQSYSIAVNDAQYFHECFQIAFQSRGSLSLPVDNWHLDYVYLAPGRSLSDTSFEDISPTLLQNSPISPYTAIPLNQFNGVTNIGDFSIQVSNNATSSSSFSYQLMLDDPRGFNKWAGNASESGSLTAAAKEHAALSFSGFSQQLFENNGVVEVSLTTEKSDDILPANDTLRQRFRVDSLWAFDDGEADALFGLNRPLGFGVQLDVQGEDSISAVWIHFEPLVHVNSINGTVTYMDDETFRIVVWNEANPDSILASRIHRISYTEGSRGYIRYDFNSPVKVTNTCWVGIQQMSDLPVGVGLDRTYPQDNFMFYDSLGTWTRIQLNGSLMIRPESFQGGAFTSQLEKLETKRELYVYPNPSSNHTVKLSIPNGLQLEKCSLRSISGKFIRAYPGPYNQALTLPDDLLSGLYIWEIQDSQGRSYFLKWQFIDR